MRRLAPLALLAITVIWGWTFVIVKEGMTFVGPLTFLALRFGLAFLFLVLLFYRSLREIDGRALFYGALIGIFLFGGYFFQTWGLSYTSATKSGLITGLSVVIVPVLSAVFLKERVGVSIWMGSLLAVGGLALLVLGKGAITSINVGDFSPCSAPSSLPATSSWSIVHPPNRLPAPVTRAGGDCGGVERDRGPLS